MSCKIVQDAILDTDATCHIDTRNKHCRLKASEQLGQTKTEPSHLIISTIFSFILCHLPFLILIKFYLFFRVFVNCQRSLKLMKLGFQWHVFETNYVVEK